MSSDSVLSPQVFHILVSLAERDQHGYAIMQDVAARTSGKLRLSPGTLYGSIKRNAGRRPDRGTARPRSRTPPALSSHLARAGGVESGNRAHDGNAEASEDSWTPTQKSLGSIARCCWPIPRNSATNMAVRWNSSSPIGWRASRLGLSARAA